MAVDKESLRLRQELSLEDPLLVRSYAEASHESHASPTPVPPTSPRRLSESVLICRLRHTRLLDAAHVLADAEGGRPVVTNGIAMCKIHHAAYDADIFGIDPSYKVGVRPDVMKEIDGPTLKHTLQEIDGSKIELPDSTKARPILSCWRPLATVPGSLITARIQGSPEAECSVVQSPTTSHVHSS